MPNTYTKRRYSGSSSGDAAEEYYAVIERFQDWCQAHGESYKQQASLALLAHMGIACLPEPAGVELAGTDIPAAAPHSRRSQAVQAEDGRRWHSQSAAAKELGVTQGALSSSLRKGYKVAGLKLSLAAGAWQD